MDDSLKLVYDPAFFERLCPILENCIPGFDRRHFIFRVFDNRWPDMSYKQRVTHIARVLRDFLPPDFSQAASCVSAIAGGLKRVINDDPGIQLAFLFRYVELFDTGESISSVNSISRHACKDDHGVLSNAESEF